MHVEPGDHRGGEDQRKEEDGEEMTQLRGYMVTGLHGYGVTACANITVESP
jgi:beta-glucosidase-like glycosyl hydrolase